MAGRDLQRIVRGGTAVQAITNILREEILSHLGQGQEEDWLLGSEDEVLESLGVSRPTLRQAVRLLEAEQLLFVRRGHGGGLWAKAPSSEGVIRAAAVFLRSRGANVIDLTEAMGVIAPQCLALAANCNNQEMKEHLAEIAEELAAVPPGPSGGRQFARLRLDWFAQAAALATNPMVNLYFDVANDLIAATHQPMYLEKAERKKGAQFFRRVSAAVVAGDAARAEKLTRAFYRDLITWLRSEAEHREQDWLLIR